MYPFRIAFAFLFLFQLVSCSSEENSVLKGTPLPSVVSPAPDNIQLAINSTIDADMVAESISSPLPPTPSISPLASLPSSPYTISPELCKDEHGPNCENLRLGDDYLTISNPGKGYLFSCNDKNPNAPGSIESKITWINFADKTWNLLEKLWLPGGTFNPPEGTYAETTSGETRRIITNNLPIDGKIGDWPMTSYRMLTEIDPNPGIPAGKILSMSYPLIPTKATEPSCVSLGAIGITINGVVIYNAADGRGEDAVAREIVDEFGGHPARDDYHYHFIPERLDTVSLGNGHSGLVGYINDGFPIYGYKGEGGVEMSNGDLDPCHGHKHGDLGYHYHATIEYPYTIGCFKGTPVSGSTGQAAP
jgi:hypothetical protein